MMELNKNPDKIVLIYEGLFPHQKHLKCVYVIFLETKSIF